MDSRNPARQLYPRTFAREVAFQFLYQDELNPQHHSDLEDDRFQADLNCSRLVEFARELFGSLYRGELDEEEPDFDHALLQQWLDSAEFVEFARSLIVGVRRWREELDQRISEAAQHWSLGRMAPTDRNVLRLGAFEILHSDTPDRVAVNEAIELARRFGGADSARFVNGILDRLMHEKQQPPGLAPESKCPHVSPDERTGGEISET